jgi:Na+/pantothenate symporter
MVMAYYAKGIIDLMQNVGIPLTALFPLTLAGFYWKRATPAAALTAIAVAIILTVPLLVFKINILNLHPLAITMFASTIAMFVVGWLTPARPAKTTAAD